MYLILGVILIAWGMIEFHAGEAWFIGRMGFARYTLEDDDWLFWAVAGLKVVGGVSCVGRHFMG